MSALAVAWAWDQKPEKNVKLLLLLLADSADRYGYVREEIIADAWQACGLGYQTVERHRKSLEDDGFLEKLKDGGFRLQLDTAPKKKNFRFTD